MADAFYGEIRIFAGQPTRIPQYWLPCNGQLLPISGNEVLFSLLGTNFGGDGRSNFALPNLQGRVPLGIGQGPGLTNRTLAQTFGEDSVTLTAATSPAHSHPLNVSTAPAMITTLNVPNSGAYFAAVDPPLRLYNDDTKPTVTTTQMGQLTVTTAGSSDSHDNNMPSLVVCYMICIKGLYPPVQ